jgi:uncharacterized membrane protein
MFVPVLNVWMALLLGFVVWLDPRVRKADGEGRANFGKVFKALRLAITGFLCAVALAVLFIGAGYKLDMSRVIGMGLAALFGVLGNFMGKIRPNYFVGVRTPWTLESREVWVKTHRLAGRLMVGASVVALAACLVLPAAAGVWFTMGTTMAVALIAVLYSFIAYRKQQPAQL